MIVKQFHGTAPTSAQDHHAGGPKILHAAEEDDEGSMSLTKVCIAAGVGPSDPRQRWHFAIFKFESESRS